MAWKSLDDMDLAGKVVLTRVDINVPVADGRVTDSTRIDRIAPTVAQVLAQGGKPVLLAHFGRPKGRIVPDMSLAPLVPALEAAFDVPVHFASDCIGPEAAKAIATLPEGEVLLLENTRFHPEEEKNDSAFAAAIADLGDVYCNDAFSAAHRAHATTEGIARRLPACAGRLMQAELLALEAALGNPERPVAAVVGGAKVSTKLDLLGNLVEKVDILIIGGGMANTFLVAQGKAIGKSLAEPDLADTARDILKRAEAAGCTVLLPRDAVVAAALSEGVMTSVAASDAVPPDQMILDAGPQATEDILNALRSARTVVWNGPLGAFETKPFDAATNAAAALVAAMSADGKMTSVAGGGDTVAALNGAGAATSFTYISTAGGAFLEWMEGKTLPGVAALNAAA
ncbi:MAG: phosphoglycerate kinase [Rhodobacteraceae bacterium]|nr:phosphoglycerate kinase [Paracoccaceae bacterium]